MALFFVYNYEFTTLSTKNITNPVGFLSGIFSPNRDDF